MKDHHGHLKNKLCAMIDGKPFAKADLREASLCGCISGTVMFYKNRNDRGVYVACIFFGLPSDTVCRLYINGSDNRRQMSDCQLSYSFSARRSIPIAELIGNDGYAFSIIYTEAINETNLIGRSVFVDECGESIRTDRIAFGLIMPVN